MAAALVRNNINEKARKQNEERNESDAYADKGTGPLKPKITEDDKDDPRNKFAARDLEYPSLQIIICRKGKLIKKEGDKNATDDEVIAYIEGTEGCEPCLTLRLDKLKKGEYYVLYRPDFKPYHKVKRLNLVFYSEFP